MLLSFHLEHTQLVEIQGFQGESKLVFWHLPVILNMPPSQREGSTPNEKQLFVLLLQLLWLCVFHRISNKFVFIFLKWLDTLWQLLAPFNTIRFKFPGALQSSSDHHASYLGLLFGFTLGKVSSLSTLAGYSRWNKIRLGWPNGSAVLESPAFTETCFMASWWRLESWLGGDTVNWYRL